MFEAPNPALRRTVMVNLKGGRAFTGVLWQAKGPWLVLRNAVMHEPGSKVPQPVDGEIVLERAMVEFIQVP